MSDLAKAFATAFVGALAGALAARAVTAAFPPRPTDEEQRKQRLARVRASYEGPR